MIVAVKKLLPPQPNNNQYQA